MDRRQFLKVSCAASGGLALLACWPHALAESDAQGGRLLGKLIEIDPGGEISIHVFKQEMGQGATTGIAMLAAEELCADWQQVTIKSVNFSRHTENYNEKWGRFGTGGSMAIEAEWQAMRTAGACAREMLRSAAAKQWRVALSDCECLQSTVVHKPSGKVLSYGALAQAASKLPLPDNPKLKPRESYTLIGQSKPSLKTPEIVSGAMTYTLDLRIPNMLHAVIARTPVVGAQLRSFNAEAALAVKGVQQVFALAPMDINKMFDKGIRGGLVVVGDSTWSCIRARDQLESIWDHGRNGQRNCRDLYGALDEFKAEPGHVRVDVGSGKTAPKSAAQVVRAEYQNPFMAHGLMEPLSAIADFSDGKHLKIWTGTQSPQHSAHHLAEDLGIAVEDIEVFTYRMGGGYGRRYFCDFMLEAALVSKRVGRPVKIIWTREDEIRFDGYHPLRKDYYEAGLDRKGNIDSIVHHCVSTHEWGGGEMTYGYGCEHLYVSSRHFSDSIVPWGSWRSVVPHLDGFAREIFIDEIAHAVNADPLEYRIQQIQRPPPAGYIDPEKTDIARVKHLKSRCLEAVRAMSGWNNAKAKGRALGVAVVGFHDRSFCAQVAEVVVNGSSYTVSRVYVAADCGLVINPNLVRAQIESSILWGLTPVLYGGVDVENGEVRQTNFHNMPIATMQDTPEIVIELHDFSQRAPCGVGEFAVVPIAPAVSNALFAATGKRIRRFPMTL